MIKYILPALTFLFATAAFAGDASTYRKLGFSADGRYFAFADTGIGDGSGFPYAKVSVVEVATNKLLRSKLVHLEPKEGEDEATGTEEQALHQAIKQIRLGDFRIQRGKILGEDLLVRLPTDASQVTDTVFATAYWAEGGASAFTPKYELKITTTPAKDESEEQWCTALTGNGPELLKLTLEGKAGDAAGFFRVLQDDKFLPKSRSCPTGYAVRQVTRFGESFVATLSYASPGFEGPNIDHMVVTTRVKLN